MLVSSQNSFLVALRIIVLIISWLLCVHNLTQGIKGRPFLPPLEFVYVEYGVFEGSFSYALLDYLQGIVFNVQRELQCCMRYLQRYCESWL